MSNGSYELGRINNGESALPFLLDFVSDHSPSVPCVGGPLARTLSRLPPHLAHRAGSVR